MFSFLFDPLWVTRLSPLEFWIFVSICVYGTGICFIRILSEIAKARILEDTPTSKIRSASQGYVELIGRAHKLEEFPLFAKLSMIPCVWYHYKIERWNSSGDNSDWETIETGSSDQFFRIEDSTGSCYVNPENADVTCNRKNRWKGNQKYPNGVHRNHYSFNNNYRYTEYRIHERDKLTILGLYNTLRGPSVAESNRKKVAELLSQWKSDHKKLVARFDSNNDGEIDMQEWEVARQLAIRQIEEQNIDATPEEAVDVIADHPGQRYPYLISTSDQQSLAKNYRWYSFGYLAGFFVCGSYSAFLLLSRFV